MNSNYFNWNFELNFSIWMYGSIKRVQKYWPMKGVAFKFGRLNFGSLLVFCVVLDMVWMVAGKAWFVTCWIAGNTSNGLGCEPTVLPTEMSTNCYVISCCTSGGCGVTISAWLVVGVLLFEYCVVDVLDWWLSRSRYFLPAIFSREYQLHIFRSHSSASNVSGSSIFAIIFVSNTNNLIPINITYFLALILREHLSSFAVPLLHCQG